MDKGFVADTPEKIQFVQLVTLKGAIKMEIAGMKRRGRSAYAIAKEKFGLKGSRQKVVDQLQAMIDEAKFDAEHR